MPGDERIIFISHSCKDWQTEAAGDTLAELEEWSRLQHSRQVRALIIEGLHALGYQVRLDVEDLREGDRWRAELHAWLGSCDGAVVLLDGSSVRSDWVRKEATILSWRRELGSRLTLIPVFLRGFTSDMMRETGFAPLRLEDNQEARWRRDDTEASLAARVLAQFDGLPSAASDDTPMGEWVMEVKRLLNQVPADYLQVAASTLGVSTEEYGRFTERPLILAHHMLHVDTDRAIKTLKELRYSIPPPQFGRLVSLVTPSWVSEVSAQQLCSLLDGRADHPRPAPAGSEPGAGPAPLLPVEEPILGKDYVQRAFCCRLEKWQLVSFCDKPGERAQNAVTSLENAVLEAVGESRDRLAESLRRYQYFAFVGHGSLRKDVLDALRARFGGSVRLVLLGGEAARETAESWATLVEPSLTVKQAEDAYFARRDAERLAAA